MPIICPSVTAYSKDEYHQQMEKVATFARRLHIDLMDGQFTKKANIESKDAWWPVGIKADFHLMYKNPISAVNTILEHQPNLIIVHSEADGNFESLANLCHRQGVKTGVAVLQRTPIESILPALDKIDHVLIFSGDLGNYGGHANLSLLSKVEALRHYKPDIEIGWDGGVNNQNISALATAGIDVFNVGGFIQNATDAEHAYKVLSRIADETGTT